MTASRKDDPVVPATKLSGEKLDFVRTEHPVPVGPNPYDNGTSEPTPEFGEPNGTPLEEVVERAHPSAYDASVEPEPLVGHEHDNELPVAWEQVPVDVQARPVYTQAPVLTNADVQRMRGQAVTADGVPEEQGGTPVKGDAK